jgi:membrane protein implicated in regulation of membrane protease activity
MNIHLEPWHIWLIIGIALFIIEIFTPAFVAGSLGVGAILAAIGAVAFNLSFNMQLVVFGVFSLLSFFAIRPIFLKYLDKSEIETNVDAMIGRQGVVIKPIEKGQYGYVKIDGDQWRAVAEDNALVIEKDAIVKVVKIEGNTIFVELT